MFARTHAIGIDIGDDACRVVGLRAAGGGYTLTCAACLPLSGQGLSPAEETALVSLLQEEGAARAAVVSALPASGCAFKTASLPPGRPAELTQVVHFEAENQFPLPLPELVWDYTLLPEPSGRRHAVIAGARQSLVGERLEGLRAVGVRPVALLPAPFAAARAVPQPSGRHILVTAGAQWSDLCLYDGERLLGCRSVMAGPPDVDGWCERLARDLRPWVAGHEEMVEIVLLGLAQQATAQALAHTTGTAVRVGDPWQGIHDAHGALCELDDALPAYATAIGLAQSGLDRRSVLNLLPRQMLESRRGQRKLAWVMTALVLAAALLVYPVLRSGPPLRDAQATLRQVQAEMRQARSARATGPGPGLLQAQQVVHSLDRPESKPLEILSLISTHLPEGVTLTDFTYERGKTVVLKGRATSQAVLADMTAVTNRMPVFTRATLDFAVLAKDDEARGYDFQITGTLPASADPTLGTGKRPGAAPGRKGMVVR